MTEKTKVLALVGPTASGKTALGVELARRLGGEIVSCDSMQIYRGMKIGTAAPGADETGGIPHRLIGFRDPRENYSAADYIADAVPVIGDIAARGKLPIIVGGTGLYLDSLMNIGEFSDSPGDPALRAELLAVAGRDGVDALYGMLRDADPEAAEKIHKNNVKRVVRALEIYRTTGKTKSEADREARSPERRFDGETVVLEFRDRSVLYGRIERRVDAMIAAGLEDEVRSLLGGGMLKDGTTAAQAIGYKEMIAAIRGETTVAEAVELIKKNTRNYAKRQLTWFRRYDAIRVYVDDGGAERDAADLSEEIIARLGCGNG